ncbi:Hypothetical predicted protein [Olea europaea subsp. europaea]|uniref:Uncharacterized protein n=1 Tax=Olea europaea subsp. europaea TaxID=158383 RepID=A0A8S0PE45_OLEEU|nr:Hypothetical predicted protein [Olea europaea subsp. europaea]
MACISIRLVVILVCLSQLILMINAVPITRSGALVQKSRGCDADVENIHKANMYGSWKVETTARRMGVELNDYPGSGANNRHTPRPPLGF